MTALSQFAHKSPKLSGSHQTEPVPANFIWDKCLCAPMRGHVRTSSHSGHHEPYSRVQNAMCKRWDTPGLSEVFLRDFESILSQMGCHHSAGSSGLISS